ncbi:MAG TPA: beta-ketoacyl synthase N-terminal-like domain-containing protein, partial [Pseudomonadales bacterium]|nr:beta-ketoacyl synthase N-terminal-like domain-containing protein [Pseudomonadales bacterium]
MNTPHTSNTLPRRVVVTGMSGITSQGQDWASIEAALRAGRTGIQHMD